MKAYMTLTCKVGAYNRVLDELIKMNLSKKEIFLLFGPVDILVQFPGLKNLNDFIKNWFNPIRMLTPQEPMVEKTQTLIVISEGKQFNEEPYAFLFLNTQPRNLEKVQEALQNIPEILSADTVFGPKMFRILRERLQQSYLRFARDITVITIKEKDLSPLLT